MTVLTNKYFFLLNLNLGGQNTVIEDKIRLYFFFNIQLGFADLSGFLYYHVITLYECLLVIVKAAIK